MAVNPVQKIIERFSVMEHNNQLRFTVHPLDAKPPKTGIGRLLARRKNALVSPLPGDKAQAEKIQRQISGELALDEGLRRHFSQIGHRFAPDVKVRLEKQGAGREPRRVLEITGFPTGWAHTAMPLLEQERRRPRTVYEA